MKTKSIKQTKSVNWKNYATKIRSVKKKISGSAEKSRAFLVKTGVYTSAGRLSKDYQ